MHRRGVEDATTASDQVGAESTAEMLFTQLYQRELVSMVRLACLLTGSNQVAQDLVHDAFIKLRPHISAVANPSGYLRSMVVNECRMWLRRRKAENGRPLPPSESMELAPDTDHLWRALLTLPPRRRAAVALRYYLDLAPNEVAEVLGCSPSTARSLIQRGLRTMRKVLEDDDN